MEQTRQARWVKSLAGGTLKQARCKRCGSDRVTWAQSKSGRWYLCILVPKAGDNLYGAMRACPWAPHRCTKEA